MSYYEKIKQIEKESKDLKKKWKNMEEEEKIELYGVYFKDEKGNPLSPSKSKKEVHYSSGKILSNVLDKIEKKRLKNIYKDITGKEPATRFNLYNLYNEKTLNKFLNEQLARRKGSIQIEEVKELKEEKETPEKQLQLIRKEKQEAYKKGDGISEKLPSPEKPLKVVKPKKPIMTIKDIQEKDDQLTINPEFKNILGAQTHTEQTIKSNDYLRPKRDERKLAITYIPPEEPKAPKLKSKDISFTEMEERLKKRREKVKKPKEEKPITEFEQEQMIEEFKREERLRLRAMEQEMFNIPITPVQNRAVEEFIDIEPNYQSDILKEKKEPKKPIITTESGQRQYNEILENLRYDEQKDIFEREKEKEKKYDELEKKTKKARELATKKEPKQEIRMTEKQKEGLKLFDESLPLWKQREIEEEAKKERKKEREQQRGHEIKTQLIGEGFKLGGQVVKTAGELGKEAIGGYFSRETQKLKGEQEQQLKQLEADLLRKSREHEQELKIKFQPHEIERAEKMKNIDLDRENRLKDIEIEKIKATGEIDIKKEKVRAKAGVKIRQQESADLLNRQIQAQIYSQNINTNTPRPYEQLTHLTDRTMKDHTITTKGEGIVQIINRPVYTRQTGATRGRRTRMTKPKQIKTNKLKMKKSKL